MEEFKPVQETLETHGLTASGPILSNPAAPGGVYIPLAIQRDASGKQTPSHKILAEVRKALQERGFQAEFLLLDENARMMEEGLRGSLISSFPEIVRNSFVSMDGATAQIWLETKREVGPSEKELIGNHVEQFTGFFPLRSYILHISNEANLATNTEIISLIRILAPATCEAVRDGLLARDFDVPSLSWINHKFDALRKMGLVVRMPNRTYALTAEALQRLGTIKGRHSPDVSRLLALARRGG